MPRYTRSARNIRADCLTRWSQYECAHRMCTQGIRRVDFPEERIKCEHEWDQWGGAPTLSTSAITWPLLDFYKTYRVRVVEWSSNFFFSITLLLH